MSGSGVTVVDDWPNNSNNPQYNGNWVHLYSISSAINDTLSYTAEVGDTVFFKFNGTGVGVVGATAPSNGTEPPVSTYVLDGASPVTFTAPSNITNTVYSQTFFLQQSLSASEHTLVINVTRSSNTAPFLLDYIGFIPWSNTTGSASSTASSSSPTSSDSSTQTSAAPSGDSKSSTPVGAIVGGTIGGVALLVAVIFGILSLRRGRHGGRPYFYKAAGASDLLDPEIKDNATTPLAPPQLEPHVYQPGATQSSLQPPTLTPSGVSTPPYPAPSAASSSAGQVMAPTLPSPPRGKANQTANDVQAPAFHADSGIRFTTQPQAPQEVEPDTRTEIPDDVPPEYTEH